MTKNGFTLIELLVVITIIAILATIGTVVYFNAPRNARDAKRKADIESISKALELNKEQNSTYKALSKNNFGQKSIPSDPGTYKYCVLSSTTLDSVDVPGTWDGTACPTQPSGYMEIQDVTATQPAPSDGTKSWIVCSKLENSVGGVPYFCIANTQ